MRWYCISWVTLLSSWCTDQNRVLCLWMPRYCLCCPEGVLDICYCSQMWHSIRVYLVFILTVTSFSVQLQRLKRSLSFKTIMRSKSVENFFQRSYSDARLPPDFITDPPPPSPPLLPGSPLVSNRSPSISPSLSPNPSISSHSPSLSLSPSLPAKPLRPQITHCFQDHVFRKPTNCQHCKHMIVGKVLNLLPRFIHSFHSFFLSCTFHRISGLSDFVCVASHPVQIEEHFMERTFPIVPKTNKIIIWGQCFITTASVWHFGIY